MLGMLLSTAIASAATPDWHDHLDWQGQHASVTRTGNGYVLHSPQGDRAIAAAAESTQTASPLFDALFAMAQDDLKKNAVTAIRDASFDHGQPMPCVCFETGDKWHYVWTRDLSYAVDLGLWHFDPARVENGLRFKLSEVREASAPQGLYVMQDTGSGGSWPISTDRVVWFLAAQHLLDQPRFAAAARQALTDTLAQDRAYAFDARFGLYRGETSFLDWREQSYPAWTANDVRFIATSYALSTNVLHYQALRLAAVQAEASHDTATANAYTAQADALKTAINAHFWRADRQLYMSYIGGDGLPVEAYDLLGIALTISSGVAYPTRARAALTHYPIWPAGSPVIWPERAEQPIYHNRALWPFVSAYALRAARQIDAPDLIAAQIRSLIRGAALAGSNQENFELLSQAVRVEDGKLSGPVVNSPRQLWSIAGYLDMVREGVFGLDEAHGRYQPKIPVSLIPMLFGDGDRIRLHSAQGEIVLVLPTQRKGNLLVADVPIQAHGTQTITLEAIQVEATPVRTDAPLYAPATPAAPIVSALASTAQATSKPAPLRVQTPGANTLYIDGHPQPIHDPNGDFVITPPDGFVCLHATASANGIESLPSPATCIGARESVDGAWPRTWQAPASGRYQVTLSYRNTHGPINSGVTAAVKRLQISCANTAVQTLPIVMPHSVGTQISTAGEFIAKAGQACRFQLNDGFNMSYLSRFVHFTGGAGGDSGPLNAADIGAMQIALLPTSP